MGQAVEGRSAEPRRVGRPRRILPRDEGGAATPPRAGDSVDGFRLETRLGEGGQGTVFRARRGRRSYAIKLLPLSSDDWAWRELEVRLRLRRVGSVKVLGCGLWPVSRPRFVYLVMPYVRGRPLYEWAKASNPTARDMALQVLEVARQLVAVHRAGVVHRDIKGANVLVRKKDGRPVVVDFGVGTYVGAPEITNPMGLPGTRHYRSPEALRFRRERAGEHSPARASDDLWALGVVLYWLLTGSYPFDTEGPVADEGALADVILKQAPEPPHLRNPRVPRALSELCLRMLEKPLEARYPDAVALCAALEAVLAEADGAWDVPLCEAWGPDDATTPQQEGLDLGDWMDKVRRLKLHARLHSRRGRPVPLVEASTLPRSPEESPPGVGDDGAEEMSGSVSPRTQGPPRHARLWGCVLGLGLLVGLVLAHHALTRVSELGATTSAVTSKATTSEVRKLAPASNPPESVEGAAPAKAATPAPVASATPRKDSTRVKTPKQVNSSQKKQRDSQGTRVGAAGKACTLVLVAGQLACSSPDSQVRPSPSRVPPPEECPAGAIEGMKALGLGIGWKEIAAFNFLEGGDFITVHRGPGTKLLVGREWGTQGPGTVFTGELLFGEGRVYGRFTQARTRDNYTYPVCMEVYDWGVDGKRGVVMRSSRGPDIAEIWSVVYLKTVDRFE